MKLDFEKLLEDRDTLMSLEEVKKLVQEEFLTLDESIKLEDITVKFHTYERSYDFYVTVNRTIFKDSDDEGISYEENYRLKEPEVIQIVNEYLRKNYKIQIKQNESNGALPGVFHFSLNTNANPETKDEVNFFYRFEYIKEGKINEINYSEINKALLFTPVFNNAEQFINDYIVECQCTKYDFIPGEIFKTDKGYAFHVSDNNMRDEVVVINDTLENIKNKIFNYFNKEEIVTKNEELNKLYNYFNVFSDYEEFTSREIKQTIIKFIKKEK